MSDKAKDMPSGEDLLASLAQEIGLDLTEVEETAKEPVKTKAEVVKDEPQTKVGGKSTKGGTTADKGTASGTKKRGRPKKDNQPKATASSTATKDKEVPKEKPVAQDGGEIKESAKSDKPITNDSGISDGKDKPKRGRKKNTSKTDDKPKADAKPEKPKEPSFDRNEIFSEWYGYKVNYMGKPMDEEGKFVTLKKRYDSKAHEKFRSVNGRMVLVVHRNKEGKAVKVQVMKETPDGKREEMPVGTTMVNPHRMENRCRAYAQLLELAYDRKNDIEEVGA